MYIEHEQKFGRMTKYKGVAASIAPFAVAAVCVGGSPAQAACTNVSTGVWDCSGVSSPLDVTSNSSALLDVTIQPGATIDGGSTSRAVRVRRTAGGGDTNVTVDGDLTANPYAAPISQTLYIQTVAGTGAVTLTGSGNVNNDLPNYNGNAVMVDHRGAGDLTVDLTGNLTGMVGAIINHYGTNDSKMSVKIDQVHAGEVGVSMNDMAGAGGASVVIGDVTTSYALSGAGRTYGVGFGTGVDATGHIDLVIGSVDSGTVGIVLNDAGHSSWSLRTLGSISGAHGDGISFGELATACREINCQNPATKYLEARDVSIIAEGDVTGSRDGIHVDGAGGDGATYIEVAGAVTGGTGAGINLISTLGRNTSLIVKDGAVISADSGDAILDTEGNAAVTVESGAGLVGRVALGAGADTLSLTETDLAPVTALDGGDGWDLLSMAGVSGSHSGSTLTGWERINLSGTDLTLSDADGVLATSTAAGEGVFLTDGSVLQTTGAYTLDGSLDLAAGTSLVTDRNAAVITTISGSVVNAGTIDMLNGIDGDVLAIAGDLITAGGVILMDVFLTGNAAGSASDLVTVAGSSSGSRQVTIGNLNSNEATGEESLLLVGIAGASDAVLTLTDRAVSGGFEYFLNKGGDGNWYLESKALPVDPVDPTDPVDPPVIGVIRPEAGSYFDNAVGAAEAFNHGWRDRAGASRAPIGQPWLRLSHVNGSAVTDRGQLDTDYNATTLLFGTDFARWSTTGADEIAFGVMAGVHDRSSTTRSRLIDLSSTGSVDGAGIGVYGTWMQKGFGQRGAYVDGWLMLGRSQADVTAPGVTGTSYDIDTTTASIEAGYSFDVAKTGTAVYWLEPQVQAIWTGIDGDTVVDGSGTQIRTDGNMLTTRLGLRAAVETLSGPRQTGYVQLDWLHNTTMPEVYMDTYQAGVTGRDAYKVAVGYEAALSEKASLGLAVDYTAVDGGGDSLGASLNLGMKF